MDPSENLDMIDVGGGQYLDASTGLYYYEDGTPVFDPANDPNLIANEDGTFTNPVTGSTIDQYGNPVFQAPGGSVDNPPPEVGVPAEPTLTPNGDGSFTNAYGDITDASGAIMLGAAQIASASDPDEYGDVYSADGKWVGNIFGLSDPTQNPVQSGGRSPNNQPGGAYSTPAFGGGGGGSSGVGDIAKALAGMLNAAKGSNAPPTQTLALQTALRNAQLKTGAAGGNSIFWLAAAAAVVLLAVRN